MHILLTGAGGFIARRIALDLLEAGHSVRGSLRNPAAQEAPLRDALRAHLTDPAALDRLALIRLDLSSDEGWAEAARGMDAILHVASPFPLEQTGDPEAVVRPAVDGTLRALRAAVAEGVDRVVLTSSTVAVMNGPDPEGRDRDERDWSADGHPNYNAYVRSKTEAERAAWDFVKSEGRSVALTVINPGFVLGPPIGDERNTSLRVIERVLAGKDPMVPPIGFETVDVRDVSRAHLAALERPETAGKRYVVAAGFLWFREIARIAAEETGRPVDKREAPKLLLRILALFDPALKGVVPIMGRRDAVSNARARDELGIDFVPAEEAAREAIRALA